MSNGSICHWRCGTANPDQVCTDGSIPVIDVPEEALSASGGDVFTLDAERPLSLSRCPKNMPNCV